MLCDSQQPLPQGTCFELHTTYPTAVLTDHSVTIQVCMLPVCQNKVSNTLMPLLVQCVEQIYVMCMYS
jgi:hypothetical protein